MDKWNQVLKGVAAIVLSFVVGMMLGLVCGCYYLDDDFQRNDVCGIGATRCHNNWAQVCTAGQWVDSTDCAAQICATVIVDDVADVQCVSL